MHPYVRVTSMIAVCALAACAGRGGGTSDSALPLTLPVAGGSMMASFALPKNTVGEELPSEGVGTKKDATWGLVGGFTQTTKAQVLSFPKGTKVTLRNLSSSFPHTFNVVAKVAGPPAHFPPNPTLSFNPAGHGIVGVGFASGTINPGKSVSATLSKTGSYLIGCAFHYQEGMQDVIVVK